MVDEIVETGDEAELLALLWKAARGGGGNVPAMRILLTEIRRGKQGSEETPSVLDELAAKRTKSAAG
jgi:hypothetical protein